MVFLTNIISTSKVFFLLLLFSAKANSLRIKKKMKYLLMGMFFRGNFVRWVSSLWENIEQMFVLTENTHLWNGPNPQVPQPPPHMERRRARELARRLIVPEFQIFIFSSEVVTVNANSVLPKCSRLRVFAVLLIWKSPDHLSCVYESCHHRFMRKLGFIWQRKKERKKWRKASWWQADIVANAFWYSRSY